MSENEKVIRSQTAEVTMYRIEACRPIWRQGERAIDINGTHITESWKELSFGFEEFESLNMKDIWRVHDAIRSFLCYSLSGEMAGFIVHKLTLAHPSLKFRIIPIDTVISWKQTKEGKPVKLDLTFHEIKEPQNEREKESE